MFWLQTTGPCTIDDEIHIYMKHNIWRVVRSRGELQLVQLLAIDISPQNIILTRCRACTFLARIVISSIDEWFVELCVCW